MASNQRILVYLKKNGIDKTPVLAKFTQCVLNYFRDDVNQLTTDVYVELKDNKLLLADDTDKTHIKIKHPPFCPLHHLSPSDLDLLPDDILNRGIDVGAAVILESSDNKILLTRRAKHLRTFPGIWVPPGGHIEENETFVEAGLRELYEESGLRITPSQCTGSTVHPVALWESAYPPKLALGQPKRHHIVIYLYGKLTSDLTSGWLSQKLKLCPKEVGACGWFDRRSIEAIVSASEEEKLKNTDWKTKLTETFRGYVINEGNHQEECELPFAPLLNISSNDNTADCERVSTGTKFALEEWLLRFGTTEKD